MIMNTLVDNNSVFSVRERRCEATFRHLGVCCHLSTSEDFEILFRNEEDFKAGMNLMALCADAFPDIKILTFELMSNHLHIVFAGKRTSGEELFSMFKRYLKNYLKSCRETVDLSEWDCSIQEINDLEYLRNAIVYDNRNGFVVDPASTPFSYPWGANRFFFNPDAKKRCSESRETLFVKSVREIFHTRDLDKYAGQKMTDGYACPMEFCHIDVAEDLFRDARHYFYKVSRDLESLKGLAADVGERIFYTDKELFSIVSSLCRKFYQTPSPALLSKEGKMDLARKMHFDYNASNKQIARMLKLEARIVDALFPKTKN